MPTIDEIQAANQQEIESFQKRLRDRDRVIEKQTETIIIQNEEIEKLHKRLNDVRDIVAPLVIVDMGAITLDNPYGDE